MSMGQLLASMTLTLVLAWAGLASLPKSVRPRWALMMHRWALFAAILFPILASTLPRPDLPPHWGQVFSGAHERVPLPALAATASPAGPAAARAQAPRAADAIAAIGSALPEILVLLALLGLGGWLRAALKLAWTLDKLPVLRRMGRVRVLASERCVPYSAWTASGPVIVLPRSLGTHSARSRLAFRHEAEHHRAGDPLFAWLESAIFCAFFWHPAARWFERRILELQEFACDEAVAGHPATSAQAYARCLLEVAELAVGLRPQASMGTVGLGGTGDSDGSSLRRRIMRLLNLSKESKKERPRTLEIGRIAATAGLLVALTGGASYLAHARTQGHEAGRALTLEEATRYAERAGGGSAVVPLTVNERVLEMLNRMVATQKGRERMKTAFERMPSFRPMIEEEARRQGVPLEVLALPVIESSYRNDLVSPYKAAGIWQFIAQTARKYDLRVDGQTDERLDTKKATVAAIRYLKDLHGIFGDWRLAFKAYNEGENAVSRQIIEHKTRDPWVLEAKASRESYLTKATAAIIIMKNPELVQ